MEQGELLQRVVLAPVKKVKRFVAADHFKVGTDNGVKIVQLGDNFERAMLGKIEEGIPSTTLTGHTLIEASLDAPIVAELGKRVETTLAHFWELLCKQPKGESGVLLTHRHTNIFHIKGVDDNLWAVIMCWGKDGWYVRAISVDASDMWPVGCRVFAR